MTLFDLAAARARKAHAHRPAAWPRDPFAILAEASANNSEAILMLFGLIDDMKTLMRANRVLRDDIERRITRLEIKVKGQSS